MADRLLLGDGSGGYLLGNGAGVIILGTSTGGAFEQGSRRFWIGGEPAVLAPKSSAFLNAAHAGSLDFSWMYGDGSGLALS